MALSPCRYFLIALMRATEPQHQRLPRLACWSYIVQYLPLRLRRLGWYASPDNEAAHPVQTFMQYKLK